MMRRWRSLWTTQPSWTSSSLRSGFMLSIVVQRPNFSYIFFCFVNCDLSVCRLKTSGTVLIKLTRTWLKSKSFTQSSCRLPRRIRVRHLTFNWFTVFLCPVFLLWKHTQLNLVHKNKVTVVFFWFVVFILFFKPYSNLSRKKHTQSVTEHEAFSFSLHTSSLKILNFYLNIPGLRHFFSFL